jgi:hypothetical protein
MGLMDVLQHYVGGATPSPAQAEQHFDAVAQSAPLDLMGRGIAAALRSDQTPAFKDMVAQLFANSNPQQRAALLNSMLRSVAPSVAASGAGGILGGLLQQLAGQGAPSVTPAQASQVTPQQVSEVAAHAETHDPSIVDRVGELYAAHPQAVKALGGAALAIVLGRMANHRNETG